MPSKKEIRTSIRAKRRGLNDTERHDLADAFTHRFIASDIYKRSKDIAVYLANDGELDLSFFIEQAWRHNKRIFLPVVHGPAFNKMWFAPFTADSEMRRNRYGIWEPRIKTGNTLKPVCLDLVIMPLVAFDRLGNRLGMGGGYYDRTFSFLRNRSHWQRPHLIGAAYDFQEVDSLNADPWDIRVHGIATESRLLLFKHQY